MARIVALMVVAVLAAAPAAALAAAPSPEPQASPFQQPQSQNQVGEQPAQAQAPTSQTQLDDGSIGTGAALLIGVGIVALIGGIWLVIARDAKRVTAGRLPAADVRGGSPTRAAHRSRRLSSAERRRRKRGRAAS